MQKFFAVNHITLPFSAGDGNLRRQCVAGFQTADIGAKPIRHETDIPGAHLNGHVLIAKGFQDPQGVRGNNEGLIHGHGIVCTDGQTLAIHTVELLPVEAYTAHHRAAVAPPLSRILDAANAGEELCRIGGIRLLTGKPRQLRIIPQRVSGKLRAFVGTGHGDLWG